MENGMINTNNVISDVNYPLIQQQLPHPYQNIHHSNRMPTQNIPTQYLNMNSQLINLHNIQQQQQQSNLMMINSQSSRIPGIL